jgi:hypothetical protein
MIHLWVEMGTRARTGYVVRSLSPDRCRPARHASSPNRLETLYFRLGGDGLGDGVARVTYLLPFPPLPLVPSCFPINQTISDQRFIKGAKGRSNIEGQIASKTKRADRKQIGTFSASALGDVGSEIMTFLLDLINTACGIQS